MGFRRARWRIYYGDGSTYCDRDGPPEGAPVTDALVIMQDREDPADDRLEPLYGKEAYFWDGARWLQVDQFGFWDRMMNLPNPKTVLFGRLHRGEGFYSVMRRADREGIG
jgi:hypothetical protein